MSARTSLHAPTQHGPVTFGVPLPAGVRGFEASADGTAIITDTNNVARVRTFIKRVPKAMQAVQVDDNSSLTAAQLTWLI